MNKTIIDGWRIRFSDELHIIAIEKEREEERDRQRDRKRETERKYDIVLD